MSNDTWEGPIPRCPLEESGMQEWRGQMTAQTNESTRRLNTLNSQIDDIRDAISKLREEAAASRARSAVWTGLAAFLGSGVAGSVVLVLLQQH